MNDNDDLLTMIKEPRPEVLTEGDIRMALNCGEVAVERLDLVSVITHMVANVVFFFGSRGIPHDDAIDRALAMAELVEAHYEKEYERLGT